MPFRCRGAADRHRSPGDAAAAAQGSESSHRGSSAGLGAAVHAELEPGKASLPTAHLLTQAAR